jgi:hypothetical protein
MNIVKKLGWMSFALVLAGLPVLSAAADPLRISAIPSAWKLQSYGGNPVLWYTGSTCGSGQLLTDPSWTADQGRLLWATIMTAKASQLPMTIDYNVNGQSCTIVDFSLDPQ